MTIATLLKFIRRSAVGTLPEKESLKKELVKRLQYNLTLDLSNQTLILEDIQNLSAILIEHSIPLTSLIVI